MRLFIAATPAGEQQDKLIRAQQILRQSAIKISLTKEENLHLTMHFLGELEMSETAELIAALKELKIDSGADYSSALSDISSFERRDGLLIYAACEVSEATHVLFQEVASVLENLDHKPEKRAWKTHITLARRARMIVPRKNPGSILTPDEKFHRFEAISLFKSEFSSQGMIYTPVYNIFQNGSTAK